MGARKMPTEPPKNQVKPNPPPAPPRRRVFCICGAPAVNFSVLKNRPVVAGCDDHPSSGDGGVMTKTVELTEGEVEVMLDVIEEVFGDSWVKGRTEMFWETLKRAQAKLRAAK